MKTITLEKYKFLRILTKSYHPHKLNNNDTFGFNLPEQNCINILSCLLENKTELSENIQIMSIDFYGEVNKQSNSLNSNVKLHQLFLKNEQHLSGVILINDLSIIYNINVHLGENNERIYTNSEVYWIANNVTVISVKQNENGEFETWFNPYQNEHRMHYEAIIEKNKTYFFDKVYGVELFKKYCQVTTKLFHTVSNPRKRTNKTLNQTPFNLKYLTSAYFTNLIKSDAFKVRGHWRLQPYKDKEPQLIWIKDFEKKGYTREANVDNKTE